MFLHTLYLKNKAKKRDTYITSQKQSKKKDRILFNKPKQTSMGNLELSWQYSILAKSL